MRILVGVCGGIAIYKTCELVRALVKSGHNVRVVMTTHAQEFVTPLLFETLSQGKVYTSQFRSDENLGTEHIDITKWADCLVVAPATANILGKFANGIADDYLSTLFTAFTKTVHLFPAMNTHMYEHPSVQRNLGFLRQVPQVRIHEPLEGLLACGDYGTGKMLEPEEMLKLILAPTCTTLQGKRFLITAGSTRTYLDPIRFLSNNSSGRMGASIAKAIINMGGEVLFIHGPLHIPLPRDATCIAAETADDMLAHAMSHWPHCDVFIGCAAINDFKLAKPALQKMKKGDQPLTLTFVKEVDVISEIAKTKKGHQRVVGFAAETEHLNAHAMAKLKKKMLDLIVVNDASRKDIAFGSDNNEVAIFSATGEVWTLPREHKDAIARSIVEKIADLLPKS